MCDAIRCAVASSAAAKSCVRPSCLGAGQPGARCAGRQQGVTSCLGNEPNGRPRWIQRLHLPGASGSSSSAHPPPIGRVGPSKHALACLASMRLTRMLVGSHQTHFD
eukprot:365029-Chlamydomonas_euryale.AAC.20